MNQLPERAKVFIRDNKLLFSDGSEYLLRQSKK